MEKFNFWGFIFLLEVRGYHEYYINFIVSTPPPKKGPSASPLGADYPGQAVFAPKSGIPAKIDSNTGAFSTKTVDNDDSAPVEPFGEAEFNKASKFGMESNVQDEHVEQAGPMKAFMAFGMGLAVQAFGSLAAQLGDATQQ